METWCQCDFCKKRDEFGKNYSRMETISKGIIMEINHDSLERTIVGWKQNYMNFKITLNHMFGKNYSRMETNLFHSCTPLSFTFGKNYSRMETE